MTSSRAPTVFQIDEVDGTDSARFGGKGAGLARMTAAALSVPPAFVISTDGFRRWSEGDGGIPASLDAEIRGAMAELERRSGRTFADSGGLPLLVSVRSGAEISMPGMMDTVLNVGITGASAHALADATGRPAFACDTLIRFWHMYTEIVLGDELPVSTLAEAAAVQARCNPTVNAFVALEAALVAQLTERGHDIQGGAVDRLMATVLAVFESWNNRRARTYRRHHGIPDDLGTAVVVQAMVYGNLNDRSGSGVAFSRDPNTGAAAVYGEYLTGRQGEDIVSGSETPVPLDDPRGLGEELRSELLDVARTLEQMYRDAVDIEFTVEDGRLYLLQVRPAKRTAEAAVQIALSVIEEGTVEPVEGLRLVQTEQLVNALRPVFAPDAVATATLLADGVASSPGSAVGEAVLDADRVVARSSDGVAVILLRPITSPLDIQGMLAAEAIVTARGGALSHAAVVSRALDKPCVVGCSAITVNPEQGWFEIGGRRYEEGTVISVDGWAGHVYEGALPHQASRGETESVARLLSIADQVSGCDYWFASWPPSGDTPLPPATGVGPLPLTDLVINVGLLDELVAEIDRFTDDSQQIEARERLRDIAAQATAQVLESAVGMDVHIRLPHLGSPRAQRLISDWTGMAPQLLLPMGMPALQQALVSGIASAADEHPPSSLCVLIAGVTAPGELAAFAELARGVRDDLAVGAVVGSLAGLESVIDMTRAGHPVWLDMIELIRSFHGFPSALTLAGDVLGAYVEAEMLKSNPLTVLPPSLSRGLADALVEEPAARGIGLIQATRLSPDIVIELRSAGLAVLSLDPERAGAVRLLLGQAGGDG